MKLLFYLFLLKYLLTAKSFPKPPHTWRSSPCRAGLTVPAFLTLSLSLLRAPAPASVQLPFTLHPLIHTATLYPEPTTCWAPSRY